MTFFRSHRTSRTITLIVGVLFLNLSFLLLEIQAVDLRSKDPSLYESIVRIMSFGFEEERDAAGESSVEVETECNFLVQFNNTVEPFSLLIISQLGLPHYSSLWHLVHLEIVSPPPRG